VVLEKEIWNLAIGFTIQKTNVAWLASFFTPLMDIDILKAAILDQVEGVPIGLCWKMILCGTQGMIPKEQQIKALYVYVDKLDVPMAKPLLMLLYASMTATDHNFPLGIQIQLLPEIDMILNTKRLEKCGKAQGMPKCLE